MPAFDWKLYLQLADELGRRNDEAALRSAISRAYYAAFNHARAYCESKQIAVDPGRGSHERVWVAIQSLPVKPIARVGTLGFRLRDKRVKADYRDEVKALGFVVALALNESKEILTKLV